ncbi:MAG: threonylcarbamoyl-AMP synthase [Ruminococcaceae bacterium]|nr:threonylcarbamoyl-AMP synthase [Oscillospiraceae bacterium]
METKVVKIPPNRVEEFEKELLEASEIIKRGGLVVFPTETVYGLGANALDEKAAEKIYSAKGRPSDNPLIIHIANPEDYEKWCKVERVDLLEKITNRFVPGPITVIQKKKDIIPHTVTAGMDTVAVRIPSHKVARRLIELSGVPVAAPSANTSGRPSPTRAEHVIQDLYGKVDMIIDSGECEVGLESTIVMLKGDDVTLLRPGGVTLEELEETLGKVKVDKGVFEKLKENEKPLAPGMKYRHYAPKASVISLKGDEEKVIAFMKESLKDKGVGVICYREDTEHLPHDNRVVVLGSKSDTEEMAHRLFDCLRTFDSIPEIHTVYARLPEDDHIGLAVVNRLMKACGYTVKEL